MKIKKLELSGFKSFVDPAILNFKPGITALVGPNGCGKSNVMDAMRWIMGEHNARNLRGLKMEDLIFNGSETRKSTGMAEVSMLLENGNGNGNGNGGDDSSFGNASEIMVTRRLFRSGESEYFINKIPCRLKDVVELFLDSGVGTRSYSIMEQGKVDYILSLKPDERRILVEEAAGISKYRSRKKEALSKMSSTKNNLFRLKDVLNEIQIQMRGLELQVKRLKRYRNLGEEIKQIDMLLTSSRLRGLQESLTRYQNEFSQYKDEEIGISTGKNSIEALLEKSRLNLTDLQKKLSQLQQNSYDLKNSIQREENSVQINERELKNTLEMIDNNKRSLDELEHELKQIDSEIFSSEQDSAAVKSGINSLEQDVSSSSETLSISKNGLREHQERIESENNALLQLAYEKTEIKNAILMNKRLLDEITLKLHKLTEEKQNSQIKLKELIENKSILEKQLNELIAVREQKEKEIQVLRQKIDFLSNAFQEKSFTLNDIKEKTGSMRARLLSLQELQNSLEGFNEGVRNIMNKDEDNSHDLAGIVGLFADIIETSPKYELAVEAALDKKLKSVIVETLQDGLNAIEYLKHGNSGRVSFIPLSLKNEVTDKFEEPGGTSLATVIKTKPEYQSIIEALLGDVLLVDTMSRALEIRDNSRNKYTIVTLLGEIIEPNGIVIGGSIAESGSGILRRNREIREYTETLKQLESQFQIIKAETEKTEQDLQHTKQAYETLAGYKQELDIKLIREKTKEEQAAKDLLLEQEKADLIAFEESENNSALEKNRLELEHLQTKEVLVQQNEEQKQQVLMDLQKSEEALRQQLEQSETRNTELRVSLAALEQKLENAESNLNRLFEQKKTSLTKTDLINSERKKFESNTETFTQNIVNSKQQIQAQVQQSTDLDREISAEQKLLHELEDFVQSNEKSLKDLRIRWDEIEPKIHDTEMQISNLSIHMEHLQKEIYEKYAISIEQLPSAPDPDSFNEEESKDRLEKLKTRRENIGEVNLGAANEFEELQQRHQFLISQEDDLLKAIDSLQKVITKINKITKQKFLDTYNVINEHFKELFPVLFSGGKAYMTLTDETDILETGIDIFAQPPGKKLQSLDLLSGGERALTVIALMFAIFLTKPSPFCLMDEIDAPLDDTNIGKFVQHLHKMADHSQFIIVTHNKLSMQAANSLYGITMEERGVSKIVSVDFH